jgi:hypothetical protein
MDTESVLLSNAKVTLSVLQELRARGLRLAIDDFGTGYSSFSYLRQYQVNKLKIDRSFVRDIVSNPDDAAIATAIIRMAKAGRDDLGRYSRSSLPANSESAALAFTIRVKAFQVGTRLETRTAIRRCNPLGRPEDVPSRLNTGFSSGLSTLLTPV